MVITMIYFVGVYGKGFPVGSFPCIYLYFSFQLFSRRRFLILRGWCAVGLIPERVGLVSFSLVPGWIKDRGWGFFFTRAGAPRGVCSQ